jgi:hypothetical protein
VQCFRDHGVANENLKRNDCQGSLVCRLKDDGTRCARLLNLKPSRRADAPTVAGFEASEFVLRHGGAEIVPKEL